MNKVAFEFGSLTIHWYGVFVALGFLAGLWTASRRAMRDGIPADTVVDLGPWLVLGGLIGARVYYVIYYWKDHFADEPFREIFMIHHGGLVFYGGLIGAFVCGLAYVKWKKLPLWKTADALAPSVALGHVFGRLGCLMNGCCFGKACDLPWAIHFPESHETLGAGVHPTQVYESALNLILYIGLAWLHRHRRFEGQVFAVYLIAYALLRAFVELFRGDYQTRLFGGLMTPGQIVSAVILAAGAVLIWRLGNRNRTAPASPA